MVAQSGLQNLVPPLDEVSIHGDFDFTLADYDRVIASVVEGTRRSKRSAGLFHLIAGWAFGDEANTVHLDVRKTSSRSSRGHRKTNISLAQEWFPSPPGRESPGDMVRINRFLSALQDSAVASDDLTCHVRWVFAPEAVDPYIPLPFPVALAPETKLTTVRGIRISDGDGKRSAILDRRTDGRLHVHVNFQSRGAITPNMVGRTIEIGQEMLEGLVRQQGMEDDES